MCFLGIQGEELSTKGNLKEPYINVIFNLDYFLSYEKKSNRKVANINLKNRQTQKPSESKFVQQSLHFFVSFIFVVYIKNSSVRQKMMASFAILQYMKRLENKIRIKRGKNIAYHFVKIGDW